MLFEKKLARAQKWLKDRSGSQEQLPDPEQLKKESQEIKLEKGELPLMIFLALIIIVPVCLIILLAICSVVFLL